MKGKEIPLWYDFLSLHITLNVILGSIYLYLNLGVSNWFIKYDSKQFQAWIELNVVLADPYYTILGPNSCIIVLKIFIVKVFSDSISIVSTLSVQSTFCWDLLNCLSTRNRALPPLSPPNPADCCCFDSWPVLPIRGHYRVGPARSVAGKCNPPLIASIGPEWFGAERTKTENQFRLLSRAERECRVCWAVQ